MKTTSYTSPGVNFGGMDLSVRAMESLVAFGIFHHWQLVKLSKKELARIPGIGKVTAEEIYQQIRIYKLSKSLGANRVYQGYNIGDF